MNIVQELRESAAEDKTINILPFSIFHGEKEVNLFLSVQKVMKVFELGKLSPLPESLQPFIGIFNMDGVPIPVLDLLYWLQSVPGDMATERASRKPKNTNRRLVICNTLGFMVGFIVDFTKKIRRQKNLDIMTPPPIWQKNPHLFMSGMIKEGDGFRYMFDIEGFLNSTGISTEGVSLPKQDDPKIFLNKRVLVVEDSVLYQKLASQFLSKHGILVDIAADGQQGLELLTNKKNVYDLVISDIEMPYMNGVEMIRSYKKQEPSPIPVLFHSSISNPSFINDLSKEGLGDYLSKFEERAIFLKLSEIFKK